MNPLVIDPENITDATITDILNDAAIDHHDNGGLYVTEFPFNFWIQLQSSRKLLTLYSYWHVQPDADELDILRFANKSNLEKIMLQFSYNSDLDRFYGHYCADLHAGLIPQNLLKLCHKFSSILDEVVDDGIEAGVLMPLPECPCDDAADANATTDTDSTVH